MGWDTKVTIIAENCNESQFDIAKSIQVRDPWEYPFACFKQFEGSSTLFFTYERRKYLPYWIIQEISILYENVLFTVIADCPDFICGPAGLVKIVNGQIIDSYGFLGNRQTITVDPNPEILLKWFGKNGYEEVIRKKYLEIYPMNWCNDNYSDRIIEFTKSELDALDMLLSLELETQSEKEWTEIKL